jgi:hypothetical protein
MKIIYLLTILILSSVLVSCEKDDGSKKDPGDEHFAGVTIAGYQVATENMLRSIPEEYINAARNNLHIAYQHTSHGTHVSYGLYGLQDYKDGDDVLFGVSDNESGKLDFRDYALSSYAEEGVDASDLSRDETAFIQATRNYLDDPDNAEINVVIWSWCSISGHNVTENYLPGMQQLISEYAQGGSKIGTGEGQRVNPVTFIFMTGHAEGSSNSGERQPKNQADTIIGYCNAHGYLCLDYFGIDTHDMDGTYWNDADDNGNSASYGGNFYQDWQDENTEGDGYFFNKTYPGGDVSYGEHNTQHITANRKAYAMWYILARIAGWDGNSR